MQRDGPAHLEAWQEHSHDGKESSILIKYFNLKLGQYFNLKREKKTLQALTWSLSKLHFCVYKINSSR